MAGIPPPNPDPLLEGKYAHPRSLKDMAGAFLLGVLGFLLFLGGVSLILGLID